MPQAGPKLVYKFRQTWDLFPGSYFKCRGGCSQIFPACCGGCRCGGCGCSRMLRRVVANGGFLVFRLNAFFGIYTHQRFRMCTKIWGSSNDERWKDNDRHDPKNTGHTTRRTRVTWVTQDDWPWGHNLWILCRGLIKRQRKASSLSRTTDEQIIDGTIRLIFAR